MMEKIKNVWYVLSSTALFAPLSALAQNPVVTEAKKSKLPSGGVSGTISNIMLWVLGIFGSLAIIAFVIAGIMYLFSFGDEAQATKAKNAMVYSIIGVIVGLIGLIIVLAVNSWLGGTATTF